MLELAKKNWTVAGAITVWGLSIFGVLQVQHFAWLSAHSVCGPWGCGPPLQALIAYHGFWLALFSLPTAAACEFFRLTIVGRIGWWLLGLGIAGLLVVGVWDAVPTLPHWLPRSTFLAPQHYVPRYLLSLFTLIDVPIVPMILAGSYCLVSARRRQKSITTSNPPVHAVFENAKDRAESTVV